MKFHLSAVLALVAGFTILAQDLVPATPVPTQPAGFQVIKVKLAVPQPGDPKTVNVKAMVGRATLVGRDYILVFDGSKAEGDLEILRLFPKDAPAPEEHKLLKAGPRAYVVPENVFFLPGRTDLMFESFQSSPEGDVFQAEMRIVKGMKASCDFGGESLEVVVSDKNHNDRLGDLGSYPCDQEGYPTGVSHSSNDRNLVQLADQVLLPAKQVFADLGQPFVMNDALWTVTVADGKIVAKVYPCKTSEIRWVGDKSLAPRLRIMSKTRVVVNQLNTKERWLLPAGDYRFNGFTYKQGETMVICQCRDKIIKVDLPVLTSNGKISGKEHSSMEYSCRELTLVAGKHLDLGPVTAAVAKAVAAPMTPDRKITFSLKMASPEGYGVEFYSGEWFNAKPKPGLHILDAAGKEILKENFNSAFGDYTWQVPADLKGTFTVEPILTDEKPPFMVTVEKTALIL